MNRDKNPYRPGAGSKPFVLAGRDTEIEEMLSHLRAVRRGAPQRSFMLYGLRGVGKTVLLTHVEEKAEALGYKVSHLEMSESAVFSKEIAKVIKKLLLQLDPVQSAKVKVFSALRVLKAFSLSIPDGPELKIDIDAAVGMGDTGDLESDLTDLFLALGEAAKEADTPVCLFIDEFQYLDRKSIRGLIGASHRITQLGLPLVFICAGLPQVAALAGEAKSYAERLFAFLHITSLDRNEARRALEGPAGHLGVTFQVAASDRLLDVAEGYPYFIQELGKHAWDTALSTEIRPIDADVAIKATNEHLDRSFYKVRSDRTSTAEKAFMKAMAALGRGPYKITDVAGRMNRAPNTLNSVRGALAKKGIIYSPSVGFVAFSVPQFDDFIRRTMA